MPSRKYNPEKRAWRGRSYKKGGEPVPALRDEDARDAKALAESQALDAAYTSADAFDRERAANAPVPSDEEPADEMAELRKAALSRGAP
jgi:hypothetical protein